MNIFLLNFGGQGRTHRLDRFSNASKIGSNFLLIDGFYTTLKKLLKCKETQAFFKETGYK